MKIGVPKEKKNHEYRVGLVPAAVHELTMKGHEVIVETNAGSGVGCSDHQYITAGATIAPTARDVFNWADIIIKVKEPQVDECALLRENQILFTYLHLAAAPEITRKVVESKCIAIAYETVTDQHNMLPLLAPMSDVAGRLSIQQGCYYLEKHKGGAGLLLGGVPGVAPARVTIIGGGRAGTNAALMAAGMQANVTVIDKSVHRLQELNSMFGARIKTLYSTYDAVEERLVRSDLIIGAVLIPGASAPKVISEKLVKKMKKGSVFCDIAIDQGGCSETSRPTTHDDPVYTVNGVIHYCVTNMPSSVARTSAFALNNATLPYVINLANNGLKALEENPGFLQGLNVYRGQVTCKEVATDLGYDYVAPHDALSGGR